MQERDSFRTRWGFILAGVGSAVGTGNIWRFPIMVSKYGGLTYIIPYLIFVLLVANSGIIEEFALGRAARSGPVGAFGMATQRRFGNAKSGKLLGVVPIIGSLGLAIGYTCVFGWIIKYFYMSLDGSLFAVGQDPEALGSLFGEKTAAAMSNNEWIIIAVLITLTVTVYGISQGIEKANKFMMPALFLMMIVLAIYIASLDGAENGYAYIFGFDLQGFANPKVWIYAFGQAFFSLSVAGNGSVIYGSYLSEKEDIPYSAIRVALFDTLASLLATIVILPAMAAGGVSCDSSGPGLIFIYLNSVFNGMTAGRLVGIVFYLLFVFAGLSSIINLYEVSIAYLQETLGFKRFSSSLTALLIGMMVAIFIQPIVSDWMDMVNNYICPLGALIAGVMFYWVCGKKFALEQINTGARRPRGEFSFFLGKYVYCFAAFVALIAGALLGGIG